MCEALKSLIANLDDAPGDPLYGAVWLVYRIAIKELGGKVIHLLLDLVAQL